MPSNRFLSRSIRGGRVCKSVGDVQVTDETTGAEATLLAVFGRM